MDHLIDTVKPIQTAFDGCLFRSRLEARWAVFLKHTGIHYEYELEGYEIRGTGKYLPDFFLPQFMHGSWVKVKSEQADLEIDKIIAVADYTGHPFIMLDGAPKPKCYDVYFPDIEEIQPCSWHIKYLPKGSHENEYRMFAYPSGDGEVIDAAPKEAMQAAKQARFEHGASPAEVT